MQDIKERIAYREFIKAGNSHHVAKIRSKKAA